MTTLSGLSRNVSVLLAVLVASIVIVVADVVIAANADSWSDVELVLYNVIAVVGIATILLSLWFLVRSRRRVRP
jgi:uncharacterized BrkB/YihY/UPF0761 family membrane protein